MGERQASAGFAAAGQQAGGSSSAGPSRAPDAATGPSSDAALTATQDRGKESTPEEHERDNGGDMDALLEDFAYKGNLTEVARLLERSAKVNARDPVAGGWTAINSAAAAGHKEVVEMLLCKRADPTLANENGNTTLHSAAARGHIHVVRLLAEVNEKWWESKAEYRRWVKEKERAGEEDTAVFDQSGFFEATVDFIEAENGNKLTAQELARALDHDDVDDYLEDHTEERRRVEARRAGVARSKAPKAG